MTMWHDINGHSFTTATRWAWTWHPRWSMLSSSVAPYGCSELVWVWRRSVTGEEKQVVQTVFFYVSANMFSMFLLYWIKILQWVFFFVLFYILCLWRVRFVDVSTIETWCFKRYTKMFYHMIQLCFTNLKYTMIIALCLCLSIVLIYVLPTIACGCKVSNHSN